MIDVYVYSQLGNCLGFFYIILIESAVIWEEDTSTEKIPPSGL